MDFTDVLEFLLSKMEAVRPNISFVRQRGKKDTRALKIFERNCSGHLIGGFLPQISMARDHAVIGGNHATGLQAFEELPQIA